MFIADEPFLNLAKPIKAVAHVGRHAGLGFISEMDSEWIFGIRGLFSVPSKQRIQAKSGSNSIASSAGSYQNKFNVVVHVRARDFAPAGDSLSVARK